MFVHLIIKVGRKAKSKIERLRSGIGLYLISREDPTKHHMEFITRNVYLYLSPGLRSWYLSQLRISFAVKDLTPEKHLLTVPAYQLLAIQYTFSADEQSCIFLWNQVLKGKTVPVIFSYNCQFHRLKRSLNWIVLVWVAGVSGYAFFFSSRISQDHFKKLQEGKNYALSEGSTFFTVLYLPKKLTVRADWFYVFFTWHATFLKKRHNCARTENRHFSLRFACIKRSHHCGPSKHWHLSWHFSFTKEVNTLEHLFHCALSTFRKRLFYWGGDWLKISFCSKNV